MPVMNTRRPPASPFALHDARLVRRRHAICPRLLGAVLALTALAVTPACSLFMSQGPTPVAQGKYYGSGNPEYDEFFLELYRTQVSMAAAPERMTAARTNLAKGLGLSGELPRDAILEHVSTRALDLARSGQIMRLKLQPADGSKPPTAVLLTRPVTRSDAVRSLAEPIEGTSNELYTLQTELEKTSAHLEQLTTRLDDLKGRSDTTFVRDGIAKVNEVERNLEDAGKVLAYMREQAATHLEETRALLDGLVRVTDTSQGAFDRPEAEPDPSPERLAQPEKPATKAPKAARKPARSPSPPKRSAKPAPAPKPAPKAPPSEPAGFEP